MHTTEKFPFDKMRGEFTLLIKDKAGKVLAEFVEKNLIVNTAKTSLAKLIGGSGGGKNVNTIAFGTNGTAADVADTTITGAVTKAFDSISYPDFNSVLFSYSLGLGEANGVSIAEFGLLSADATLFSRKVRSAILKTADIQFTGTWKIIF